jgi:hypothetical protein
MKQEIKDLLAIFDAGIDNYTFVNSGDIPRPTRIKSIINVLRTLLLVAFGKKEIVDLNFNTVKLEWQPLHKKVLSGCQGKEISISNHKQVNSAVKLYQLCSFNEVMSYLLTTPAPIKKRRYTSSWLMYRILNKLISGNAVDKILVAGHYDSYTTWITMLADKYGKYLIISQHGVCAGVELPHKIPVSEIRAFSHPEAEMFKKFVLNPDKTTFVIKGFKSSVHFETAGFEKRTIAIASQPGYESLVEQLAFEVLDKTRDCKLIIYPHPLDSFRDMSFIKYKDVFVEITKKRYRDITVLIVFNSTLAYDYFACNDFKGQVVCYYSPIDDEDLAIYHDTRIKLIEPSEFEKYLLTALPQ